jgi:hypothetical protein
MANEFKIKNGLVVSGSADFEQDLTVRGRLTADELHISIVSSSVLFESGSTQFGNSITDTHKVTGSLSITGSMSLNGQSVETNRLSVTTFNTYTASLDPRISDLETSTGSINSFTSSTNLRLTSLETSTGSINTYTASNTTNINAIHTSTSSLNTFTSSANGRLNSIEGVTGSISSLNTYTGSNNTIIGTLQTSTSSLNSFTASAGDRLTAIETSTGSLNSYSSSNTTNVNAIHTATSSLNSFTSSASDRLNSLETSTGSINSYTSSNTTNINAIHTATSSLNSYTSSNTTNINAIHTATASLNTFTSSAGSRLTSIETSTGSLNTYTSSNTTNINAIHTATSSLNSFTSSATSRLNSIEGVTGSIAALNTYTGSNDSTNTEQNNRLGSLETKTGSLESKTGSYATTGSNSFNGSQTITGSLTITQNLTVLGSSSLLIVTSSQLALSSSTISVNIFEPAERFGGLKVYDSGSESHLATASLLWDSQNNHWIYQNASGSNYSGGMLLAGPRNTGSLGDEVGLTSGRIAKSVGGDHLDNSNITDTGTLIKINSDTEITGTFTVGGGGKIISSGVGGDEGGEILLGIPTTNTTLTGQGVTIDVYRNKLRIFEQGGNARGAYLDITTLGNGVSTNLLGTAETASFVEYSNVANKPSLVSGSSQISFNGITDKPTLVSGSSQITFLSISSIPAGLVSGSSQVLNGSGVWSGSAQLPAGTVSGSSQVLNGSGVWSGSAQLPSGIVSGSSQVLAGTTIHSGAFFNGISVVSGSGQISFNGITDKPALVSGSSQITFGSVTGVPSGLVSGSSQITFLSISSIPSGLVSGSSQVAFSSLSGLPSGIVSGSSQISFGSISGVPSGLVSGSSQVAFGSLNGLPSGLVSGSSQISFGSISNIPSGIVSGSSQITFSGISSKPTTISGYGITDAITTSNISSQTVASASNSTTVGGITPIQFFNNMGDSHATRTSFDASTPSYNFGFRYVQGNTNGPGTGASQYYSWYIGLGNDYPATGAGSYGAMFAVDRNSTTPYLSVRYNENNNFSSWRKIYAGYADSAGSVSGANVSGNISGNASNITSYTINQSVGTSNLPTFAGVKGSSYFDAQASSGFRIRNSNDSANAGGYTRRGLWEGNSNYDPGIWAETGYGVYVYTNGSANIRTYWDTSGHLLPGANNTYNLGSTTLGWANVYTNDLHLSNMNKPEGNDIDGTSGNWTIQEGAENLYIINNNNGKKFKISLEEIK